MLRKVSETVLRIGFICSALLVVGISAIYSWYTENRELLALEHYKIEPTLPNVPKNRENLGVLTYLKRNYKKWHLSFKRNPEKWLQFKLKIDTLLNNGSKPVKDEKPNEQRKPKANISDRRSR